MFGNQFQDAVDRITEDRPRQYVFTVEIVLPGSEIDCFELTEAIELIQQYGSFDIVDVAELSESDGRRL